MMRLETKDHFSFQNYQNVMGREGKIQLSRKIHSLMKNKFKIQFKDFKTVNLFCHDVIWLRNHDIFKWYVNKSRVEQVVVGKGEFLRMTP